MKRRYSEEPLRAVITPIERAEQPVPGKSYRQLGVRLWGEGAYEREPLDGGNTRYSALYQVRRDEVVVNKIWARNGSVALVPPSLDGCYVSGEFPTFIIDHTRLIPRWFHWLTKTSGFWQQCDQKSQGTSGKNRIRPEQFLSVTIPLPPLDEQRRIVARIEELAGKIEEARGLRREAIAAMTHLWSGVLRKVYALPDAPSMALKAACIAIIDNPHSTPIYDGEDFPCVRSQDVGWGSLDFSKALRTSEREFSERTRRGEPQEGDIVYVREGDVGRCAVVDGSQRFCLGQRVMMFRPNPKLIRSDFLMYQLMAPQVLHERILSGKTGTTSHHVNVKHMREVVIRVPPLSVQADVESSVQTMQTGMDLARRIQTETAAELDALLPSILDRAFKGEL